MLWLVGAYLAGLLAVGWVLRGRARTVEDFALCGRRLPLALLVPTLIATWFGAGTLLTTADEIHEHGVQAAWLDPLGAATCLVIASIFASRVRRSGNVTLPGFFGARFGSRARLATAVLMVPSYLGWIAAQFVALAGVLQVLFGWPVSVSIVGICAVGTAYTLLGGMWAVAVTDAVQLVCVVLGLAILTVVVLGIVGEGHALGGAAETFPDVAGRLGSTLGGAGLWTSLALFASGALGNIPSQELWQRVMSGKSDRDASRALWGSGFAYAALGIMPIVLGVAGSRVAPEIHRGIVAHLATTHLGSVLSGVFILAVVSAVLSTIDSAILAPATILSEDVLSRAPSLRKRDMVRLRGSVVAIAMASLVVALSSASAFSLLHASYELGLVAFFVPFIGSCVEHDRSESAALASLAVPSLFWVVLTVTPLGERLGASFTGPACGFVSGVCYLAVWGAWRARRLERESSRAS